MKALLLTPKARSDIEAIWDYTVDNWGTNQAEVYIKAIQKTLEGLADSSTISQSAESIRKNYRKTIIGSHTVFFKETNAAIEVVRILHHRMSLARL